MNYELRTKFFLLTIVLACMSCGNTNSGGNTPQDEEQAVEVQKPLIRSNRFYERLLDHFCKMYYDEAFEAALGMGARYIPASITIEITPRQIDDNTVEVKGTHLYHLGPTGLRDPKEPQEFSAIIRDYHDDTFQIDFTRTTKYRGNKQSTGFKPITYTDD